MENNLKKNLYVYKYMCICITKSLCYTLETNTIL